MSFVPKGNLHRRGAVFGKAIRESQTLSCNYTAAHEGSQWNILSLILSLSLLFLLYLLFLLTLTKNKTNNNNNNNNDNNNIDNSDNDNNDDEKY